MYPVHVQKHAQDLEVINQEHLTYIQLPKVQIPIYCTYLLSPNIDFLQAFPNNLKYFKYE